MERSLGPALAKPRRRLARGASVVRTAKLGALAQTMDYYHYVRREIAPLLPECATRILEVGAGAAGTLKWIKTVYPAAETTAVELRDGRRIDAVQHDRHR